MRIPPPPRLVVVAGAVVTVHVARKVLKGLSGKSRNCSETRQSTTPRAAAVVHAFQASTPSLVEAGSPPPATSSSGSSSSSRAVLGSGLVLLLATVLICTAAGAALLREQWDLAAAVAVAWLLVLLSQVLQPCSGSSSSSSSCELVELVEADARVELVDADPAQLPGMSGTWIKDNAASDSMEPAMALIHLNGLTRSAVRLIKGMKVSLDDEHFEFGIFSVISWFKITERYTLGQPCQQRRRDLRRGKSSNVARLTPWGSLLIEYEWGAPHSGRGTDEFTIDAEGRLNVECKLSVGGQTVGYRLVYYRKH